MKTAVFIALMIPCLAIAGGYKPPPKGGNDDGQKQEQRQSQGQAQHSQNTNANHNQNKAMAGAVSGANANSNSNSNSYSSSGGNDLTAEGGESRSSSKASGGHSSAVSGDSISEGGKANAQAAGGEGGHSVSDLNNDVGITVDNSNDAVSSAAAIFAGQCQTGASGQWQSGGYSLVRTEQFCQIVEMANINWQAYKRTLVEKCEPDRPPKPCNQCRPSKMYPNGPLPPEQMMENYQPKCEAVCTNKIASVRHIPHCDKVETEYSQMYLERYHDNLNDAYQLIENTNATGLFGRIMAQVGPWVIGIILLL